MQLLWLRTDEDIEIRNSHHSIIIDSGLKILIFLGGGSRSDTILQKCCQQLSSTRNFLRALSSQQGTWQCCVLCLVQ